MTSAPLDPSSNDGSPSWTTRATPTVLVQRYELGALLGQGGSAQVRWAWDRLLNRAVAVKLFATGVSGPDLHRQDHELAALTSLLHPGLVELYDTGEDHGRPYLVMRLVTGPSLAAQLRDVPLPVATTASLGAQVAGTLAYIHAHGVTHRDIKPANVLLDERDGPLLADFGIALLVDITRVTLTGGVIGTAAYMAPEQALGEPVGPPADVYSLGLVLLEALTGRREYPGTSVESACARLHRAPAVPDNLPAGLTHTLRRMTAIEPAARPSSAAAASALLVAAAELHGGPAAAYTDLPTELLGEPMQRTGSSGRLRGRVLLASAACGIALAAGLLGPTILERTSEATRIPRPPATAALLPPLPAGPPLSQEPPAATAVALQTADTPPMVENSPGVTTGKLLPQAHPASGVVPASAAVPPASQATTPPAAATTAPATPAPPVAAAVAPPTTVCPAAATTAPATSATATPPAAAAVAPPTPTTAASPAATTTAAATAAIETTAGTSPLAATGNRRRAPGSAATAPAEPHSPLASGPGIVFGPDRPAPPQGGATGVDNRKTDGGDLHR